jgi:glycosyltransferase involved in cell wall biosynthesis
VRILPIPLWRQALFAIRKRRLGVYRFPLPPRAARRAFRDIRPDVILAHFGGAGAAVAPVARELKIPLVVVFHAFDLFMRHFQPATYAELWESGAMAVAISEHGTRRLIELGCPERRIRVIHCGVDASRFPIKDERPPSPAGCRLVAVGRIIEKKGFDDLIRALAMVGPLVAARVSLDIWGEGPLRPELEKLARTLGLRNVVAFRGPVDSGAIPGLLREYDAFALPSRTARNGDTEGIPITILEAQAAGLPVVSTRHAGIPEGLPPTNHGLLAREGDVDDLADKLLTLAAQPERWGEIGLRGREWVLRHFSLRDETRAYRRLFEELVTPCL